MREMKLQTALVGSRGIPAKYGGNETFVEEISKRLVKKGFDVYVSCESSRFFEDEYNGIKRIHSRSIQGKNLTIPFINDVISTLHLLLKRKNIDVVYYVAPDGVIASIIAKMFKKKVVLNPDGIEWKRMQKRSKFAPFHLKILYNVVFALLYLTEYLSAKLPDVVVADSLGIKEHLEKRYKAKNVVYIPYGARKLLDFGTSKRKELEILNSYGLSTRGYYLTVARIVAENNIHLEIEGFKRANTNKRLVIVGNFNEKDVYTKHLFKLRGNDNNIIFLKPIYDREVLGVLRKNCFAYIHAYEVGGTNPSLLEQMLFKRPILAYDVPFNKEVLEEGGVYFKDAEDLSNKMEMLERGELDLRLIRKIQIKRVVRQYNWERVAKEYERVFRSLLGRS